MALPPIESDHVAMEDIHRILDGTEWDAGTIELVAEIVTRTGRKIRTDEERQADEERNDRNEYAALPDLARKRTEAPGRPWWSPEDREAGHLPVPHRNRRARTAGTHLPTCLTCGADLYWEARERGWHHD